MCTPTAVEEDTGQEERRSRLTLVVLFPVPAPMSFNVAPPAAATSLIIHGLAVAALTVAGARVGQQLGWLSVFGTVPVVVGASSVMMIISPSVGQAIGGQFLAGAAVLRGSKERDAVYAMFIIVATEAAVICTVPAYVRVVQECSAFPTLMAMLPFNLTVLLTASVVAFFHRKLAPRTVAQFSFTLTTLALAWLELDVMNNRETLSTTLGVIDFGIGQRVLVTLLSSGIINAMDDHPELPEGLIARADFDESTFISNDDLREVFEATGATESQIDAAVEVNEDARLDSMRLGLLLAGISAVAAIPASRLPNYRPHEVPLGVGHGGE